MDKIRGKKMRAAIAAVMSFLEEEERAASASMQRNRWARSGRELIMKNRTLMQRREYAR